jgi:SAM-dependent methyltransferase
VTPEELRTLIRSTIAAPTFERATFAGTPRFAKSNWVRIVVRTLELREQPQRQFSYFDGRQTIVKNFAPHAMPLDELLACGYSGIHLDTTTEQLDIRISKKGYITLSRSAPSVRVEQLHNRVKDVPLPEGRADQLLEVMGIMSADGRVKPTMRAKYTQINEFLKQLDHALAQLAPSDRALTILDAGCGASYLTLAVHHYLNEILGRPARILGVDVNDALIRASTQRAESLAASNVHFMTARIGQLDTHADIVIALHACDTATDDALAQAIRGEAKLILCVPCCHRHINHQLRASTALQPMVRHGILRERTADILTDSLRSLILRIMGYRTEIAEFVNLEHTARNLIIRAVRSNTRADAKLLDEYRELCAFWNVQPYLAQILGERFAEVLTDAIADQSRERRSEA